MPAVIYLKQPITYVLDGVPDDLTFDRPARAGDVLEGDQVQWCPETHYRPTSLNVDEQLPGPQRFI